MTAAAWRCLSEPCLPATGVHAYDMSMQCLMPSLGSDRVEIRESYLHSVYAHSKSTQRPRCETTEQQGAAFITHMCSCPCSAGMTAAEDHLAGTCSFAELQLHLLVSMPCLQQAQPQPTVSCTCSLIAIWHLQSTHLSLMCWQHCLSPPYRLVCRPLQGQTSSSSQHMTSS